MLKSIEFLNAQANLAYVSALEHVQQAAEAAPSLGLGKAWLMGAVAVNSLVSRVTGGGLFEGAEAEVLQVADMPVYEEPVYAGHDDVALVAYVTPEDVPPDNDEGGLVAVEPAVVDAAPDNGWEQFWDDFSDWFYKDDAGEIPPVVETSVDDPPLPVWPAVEAPDVAVVPVPDLDPETGLPVGPDANQADGADEEPSGPAGGSAYAYNLPPQACEYLWEYMQRIGVPEEIIMTELEQAAERLEATTDSQVEWHGSGRQRWLEVDGQSDTPSLWRLLQPHLEHVSTR